LRGSTPDIDKFLIGDNPFIGVDHLSRERARDRENRLHTQGILEVIDTAFTSGAQGLAFTTHPRMYEVLKEMKSRSYSKAFGLYPLLPYAQEYVRVANEKGLVGLAREILSRLSWAGRARTLVGGGLSLVSPDPERILRTYVDAELDILFRNVPPGAVLKSVLLHEIVTDLAMSLGAKDLVKNYAEHITDKYHVKPGFATRNFARFVGFAKQIGLELDQIVILTPFNAAGFQMNPSREACERTLREVDGANIIAMSILASGYLALEQALEYLKQRTQIRSYVVGASTRAHARQTFSALRERMVAPSKLQIIEASSRGEQ